MPYIAKHDQKKYDKHIDEIVNQLNLEGVSAMDDIIPRLDDVTYESSVQGMVPPPFWFFINYGFYIFRTSIW